MTCLLYPNAKCPSNPLEAYNSVLCHDGVMYNSSFTLMYDNHMLSHYQKANYSLPSPTV